MGPHLIVSLVLDRFRRHFLIKFIQSLYPQRVMILMLTQVNSNSKTSWQWLREKSLKMQWFMRCEVSFTSKDILWARQTLRDTVQYAQDDNLRYHVPITVTHRCDKEPCHFCSFYESLQILMCCPCVPYSPAEADIKTLIKL